MLCVMEQCCVLMCLRESLCRMWYIKCAEGVMVLKRFEGMQPSKMKFSHFMDFYTALSLKCLDAVVYLFVIGVYSED